MNYELWVLVPQPTTCASSQPNLYSVSICCHPTSNDQYKFGKNLSKFLIYLLVSFLSIKLWKIIYSLCLIFINCLVFFSNKLCVAIIN